MTEVFSTGGLTGLIIYKQRRLYPSTYAINDMMKQTKQRTAAPSNILRAAGGGAKIGGGRFTALSLSDSEEEKTVVVVPAATDLGDLTMGESWGDRLCGTVPARRIPPRIVYAPRAEAEAVGKYEVEVAEVEVEEQTAECDWEEAEADLWRQPFAQNLAVRSGVVELFDTRLMSDEDYAAFMTYLYAHGWNIQHEERRWVRAMTGDHPPRVWVPKQKTTIPRFCRAAHHCDSIYCNYVHSDTIHKIDRPCKFGAGCGANDVGKRALCVHMHPGETWAHDLCIHRPKE